MTTNADIYALNTQKAFTDEVIGWHTQIFGFPPDPATVATWSQKLQNGTTGSEMQQAFQTYKAAYPGYNAQTAASYAAGNTPPPVQPQAPVSMAPQPKQGAPAQTAAPQQVVSQPPPGAAPAAAQTQAAAPAKTGADLTGYNQVSNVGGKAGAAILASHPGAKVMENGQGAYGIVGADGNWLVQPSIPQGDQTLGEALTLAAAWAAPQLLGLGSAAGATGAASGTGATTGAVVDYGAGITSADIGAGAAGAGGLGAAAGAAGAGAAGSAIPEIIIDGGVGGGGLSAGGAALAAGGAGLAANALTNTGMDPGGPSDGSAGSGSSGGGSSGATLSDGTQLTAAEVAAAAAKGLSLSDIAKLTQSAFQTLTGIKALTSGSGAASGTTATGNTGTGYVPTGLSTADQAYLQALQSQRDFQQQVASTVNPALYQTFQNQSHIDPSGMIAAGNQAGQQYKDVATLAGQNSALMGQQAGINFGNQGTIDNAGAAVYALGMDPQKALYDRTLQQTQEQARAASSLRGIGTSGNAAGLENQAVENFNIDWQNNQLARATTGLDAYTGALKTGAGLGQLGSADVSASQQYAGQVPEATLLSGSTPVNTQLSAYGIPGQAANTYASGIQNDIMQGNQNIMQGAVSYMNQGISASGDAFNNGLALQKQNNANTAAGVSALGSGLDGLAGLAGNSTVNNWASSAGNWLSNIWGSPSGAASGTG